MKSVIIVLTFIAVFTKPASSFIVVTPQITPNSWVTFSSYIFILKHDYRLICFIMHKLFFLIWMLVKMRSTDEIVKDSMYDASFGCFKVPARTTSVFVSPRKGWHFCSPCVPMHTMTYVVHISRFSLQDTTGNGFTKLVWSQNKSIREVIKSFYIEASIQMNKLLPLRELVAMFFLLWVVKQNKQWRTGRWVLQSMVANHWITD